MQVAVAFAVGERGKEKEKKMKMKMKKRRKKEAFLVSSYFHFQSHWQVSRQKTKRKKMRRWKVVLGDIAMNLQQEMAIAHSFSLSFGIVVVVMG